MNGMDEYQKEALRTANTVSNNGIGAYSLPDDIVQAVGEYVEKLPERQRDDAYDYIMGGLCTKLDQMIWSLGLTGEAGEFADMMKKHHGHGHELDKQKAASELGDVMWYVAVLADSLGFNMSTIASMNVEKLRKRYKGGFSILESKNRNT